MSQYENLPRITIITPSLNQGKFIEETICSVLNQNYPNLEYIIIDGGSTDETVDIIKKYENRIAYWVSEPDKGQSDAINKGLALATGDIFNWLNSDDVYLPDTLLSVGRYFLDTNLNVLCGREYLWFPDGRKELTNGSIICSTLEETIAIGHIQQPPTFFRLPIVKLLRGVAEDLHFCMDAELWVNYLTYFGLEGVKKVDLVTNLFRMHQAAKTSNLKSVFFRDKFNILVSLLYSLESVDLSNQLLKDVIATNLYFSKRYSFSPLVNQKFLKVYIVDRLLDLGVQYLPWSSVFRLYFYVLSTKPMGWHWRFYATPFIKIKRLFQPL